MYNGSDPSTFIQEYVNLGLLGALAENLPSVLINLAIYIFTALALYTIAKRRGIHNPWLAWVPIANMWLLGCIADHFRYQVRKETKCRRKVLLGLEIAVNALAMVILGLCVKVVMEIFAIGLENLENMSEDMLAELLATVMSSAFSMVLLSLPLMVVAIVHTVFYLIALHDVYKSCAPENATMYVVLGFIFKFLTPIFLMICRDKDDGMQPPPQPVFYHPPVYQPPTYQPPAHEPAEPWEREDKS